jgi:hypothetical protein
MFLGLSPLAFFVSKLTFETVNPFWHFHTKGLGIFLFTTASRPALGPTQPPIQWVLRALSPGVNRSARDANHSPSPSTKVKNARNYTSIPPIRLRCMVLS